MSFQMCPVTENKVQSFSLCIWYFNYRTISQGPDSWICSNTESIRNPPARIPVNWDDLCSAIIFWKTMKNKEGRWFKRLIKHKEENFQGCPSLVTYPVFSGASTVTEWGFFFFFFLIQWGFPRSLMSQEMHLGSGHFILAYWRVTFNDKGWNRRGFCIIFN